MTQDPNDPDYMIVDEPDDDDNSEDVLALAHEINLLCHEKAVGTILYALSTVFSSVANGSATGDRYIQATMFAGVAEMMHAGLEAVEQPTHTLVVGDTAQVDPEQQHRATALCPMFTSLMVGLGEDHDARDVLNAWDVDPDRGATEQRRGTGEESAAVAAGWSFHRGDTARGAYRDGRPGQYRSGGESMMPDPVSLDQAIAMVDAWGPEFGFQLHEIARALRRGLAASQADLATRLTEEEARSLVDQLGDLRDKYAKLNYQARMMGVSLADKPDGYGSKTEAYPLSRCLDLMDAWREGVECWGLHQMCRVLRREYEEAVAEIEINVGRTGGVILAYDAAEQRALAAVPCARHQDQCPAPDYRYAPCCNLRVALLPGEPFPTDYLAESGEVHLFEPTVPEYPGAVRRSVGCVKLIEPTLDERPDRRDSETLDWDFKHRYSG